MCPGQQSSGLGRWKTLREMSATILVPGPVSPHQWDTQGKQGLCVCIGSLAITSKPPKQLFTPAVKVSLVIGVPSFKHLFQPD